MNFDSLSQLIRDQRLPAFHAKNLIQIIGRGFKSYDQLTSWPLHLRQAAIENIPIHSYTSAQLTTGTDGNAKALLTYSDNNAIETVFIQTKPDHYSICVSCQSGCAMGCAFCATGSLGLLRSLTAEEICDQFLYWRQTYPNILPKSVVFMGMGEPFANQIEVFKAIDWLHTYYGLGYRHITVSTCGLPAGIQALSKAYPQVNLAISLHAANQRTRESIMPIAKKISLNELATTIHSYLSVTNRQITLEYLLLNGLNDSTKQLDYLIDWLRQFPKQLVHVNLIGYNQTDSTFSKPSNNKIRFAKNYLQENHVSVTIRKSQGEDIIGACGQLSLNSNSQK
jgi:23S rRNA (adenine2503-C2)-methyltransferase